MRVLMYGWEFPPHISGGLGTACLGLTQALGALGHRVSFVLPKMKRVSAEIAGVELLDSNDFTIESQTSREVEQRWRSENVSFEAIDSSLRPYLTDVEYRRHLEQMERREAARKEDRFGYRLSTTGDYGPDLMSEVHRYAQVAGAVAERVPHDVIHTHDWMTVLAGLEAKRVSGKKVVAHIHALEPDRSGEHVNQAVYDIERYGMEHVDRIIAVSGLTKQTIVGRYGIAPDKVKVVYNAVSSRPRALSFERISKRDKVVLFLGRITFQKGPEYFVEAAARILSTRDDVRFVMAGSGDMAPRIIQRVAELKIGKRFHFTGFLSGAAVDRIYERSDVYVMPSVSEPFGITPLEAMRFDVPVIISRQSGVAEVLRHALKVEFWDIDDLADKIMALLDHSPLRDELVKQGAQELQGFQWRKAAQRLETIYRECAAG